MKTRLLPSSFLHVALLVGAPWVPAAWANLTPDPVGDGFNGGALDLVGINAVNTGTSVDFTLSFAAPVSPASSFAANSLLGFLDLDVDQSAATGGTAAFGGALAGGNNWVNVFVPPNLGTPVVPGPLISLGSEFYVDLGSELANPGLVDVFDTVTDLPTGSVPITFQGSLVSFSISFALIGGDDGVLNYSAVVGDSQSPTDRFVNGELPASTTAPVPESSGILALGATLLGCFGFHGVRRWAAAHRGVQPMAAPTAG